MTTARAAKRFKTALRGFHLMVVIAIVFARVRQTLGSSSSPEL
jgi:hypothetical protein